MGTLHGNDVTQCLFVSLACEIQAGDPFMLFSVEHEAFVSVSGSFAIDTLPEILQEENETGI